MVSERHWKGTKEPVVILLGWAGCKDKHLSKYSAIYNEQVHINYSSPFLLDGFYDMIIPHSGNVDRM